MKAAQFGVPFGPKFLLSGDAEWFWAIDKEGIVCGDCSLNFKGIDGSDRAHRVTQLRIRSFRLPVRVFAFYEGGKVAHYDVSGMQFA